MSVFVHADLKQDQDTVDAILAYLSTVFEVRVDKLGLEDKVVPSEAPDLAAIQRVLRDDEELASLRGRETTLLEMLREQRQQERVDPAPTINGRVAEVERVAEAFSVAHELLHDDAYAMLRGLEARLYRRVLTTPGSGTPTGSRRDRLREAFRAAATAELDDSEE